MIFHTSWVTCPSAWLSSCVVITDQVLLRDVVSSSFHSTPELRALSWQGNPAMRRNVTQVSGLLSSPENCSAVKWQRAEGIWSEYPNSNELLTFQTLKKGLWLSYYFLPVCLSIVALRVLDAVNTLNCSWNYLPHEASSSIHGIWVFSHDSCFQLTGLRAWITCHMIHVI